MVQAKLRLHSIEEYAALDASDLPEGPYELVDGAIVEMPTENLQNITIVSCLFFVFLQTIPFYLLHRGTEIQVARHSVTCRQPDFMVLTEASFRAMAMDQRSMITLQMPNPALVVEVVSPGEPGEPNYQRDYVEKPSEYAARGILEYWRIDPSRQVVTVLQWVDGQYQETTFQGQAPILSPTFPDLQLTADQILNAGQVGEDCRHVERP